MGKICYSETNTLNEVLDGKTRFIVPDYQRSYNWNKSKVEELWNDLIDNYTSNPDQVYLLGPIVSVKNPGLNAPNEIVDGQQRLVTLTLLFCTLRDSLFHYKPESKGDKNDHNELITEINKSIKFNNEIKLIELNDKNDDYIFKHICGCESNLELDKFPKSQLIENYNTLQVFTKGLCEDFFESQEYREGIRKIRKTFTTIKNNTYFVYIEINDKKYAYQVFQSLNSKGQTLRQADLIKSHLLNVGSDDVGNRWDKIRRMEFIREKPDDFLYYSMLSRTCTESKKGSKEILKMDLYNEIKNTIKNPNQVDEYLENLIVDSKIIEKLYHPNRLNSENYRNTNLIHDLTHLLYGIKQINAKYFLRPIIAAYREWGLTEKTNSLIDCLLKFFFMHRTISKLDIDLIKRISRDVTCKICSGKDLDEILYIILKNEKHESVEDNIDQQRFIKDFEKNIDELKNPVATYILYSLERILHSKQGTHPAFGKYHVEHIFPKNPKEEWSNKDELKNHTNRLGNLTLLDEKWSSNLKNSGFETKLDGEKWCYSKSSLELNKKYLVKYKQWDVNKIKDREKQLINLAGEVWDLSEYAKQAKKPNNDQ